MKLREGFILRNLGERPVLVAVGGASKHFNGMVKLNETSADIVNELINGDPSAEEIAETLCSKYDVDKETALSDVNDFVEYLKKNDIMEK